MNRWVAGVLRVFLGEKIESKFKKEEENKSLALFSEKEDFKSLRVDKLDQDAKDVLQWAFVTKCSIPGPYFGMKPWALEVKCDTPINHVCYGGNGLLVHFGAKDFDYLVRKDNPEWAVVFPHDLGGDANRGLAILQMKKGGYVTQ